MSAWSKSAEAMLASVVWSEFCAAAAAVVILLGVRLCWRSPRYRMSIEEREKDGLITEEQARRRIRFMEWFGPAVAIAGCVLLALAIR